MPEQDSTNTAAAAGPEPVLGDLSQLAPVAAALGHDLDDLLSACSAGQLPLFIRAHGWEADGISPRQAGPEKEELEHFLESNSLTGPLQLLAADAARLLAGTEVTVTTLEEPSKDLSWTLHEPQTVVRKHLFARVEDCRAFAARAQQALAEPAPTAHHQTKKRMDRLETVIGVLAALLAEVEQDLCLGERPNSLAIARAIKAHLDNLEEGRGRDLLSDKKLGELIGKCLPKK